MRRKRLTADELVYVIVDKLRENDAIATSHSPIAVVPHDTENWAVVISSRTRRKEPDTVQRIDRIQADLRKLYLLAE